VVLPQNWPRFWPGFGFAGVAAASPAPAVQGQGSVQKLDANGKPSDERVSSHR